MLKKGDKIGAYKRNNLIYTDVVIQVKNMKAYTKNGKIFGFKCSILKSLAGLNDYGFNYKKL